MSDLTTVVQTEGGTASCVFVPPEWEDESGSTVKTYREYDIGAVANVGSRSGGSDPDDYNSDVFIIGVPYFGIRASSYNNYDASCSIQDNNGAWASYTPEFREDWTPEYVYQNAIRFRVKAQGGWYCRVGVYAADKYEFDHWEFDYGLDVGETTRSEDNPATVKIPGGTVLFSPPTCYAYFKCKVELVASPPEGGSVSGGGFILYGTSCTVTASPNSGYMFRWWEDEHGSFVSGEASYTFRVSAAIRLVAVFVRAYTISASVSPSGSGYLYPGFGPTFSAQYTAGQYCSLKAYANSNYEFLSWTENGVVVSSNAFYQFQVSTDRTLVANFSGGTSGPLLCTGAGIMLCDGQGRLMYAG